MLYKDYHNTCIAFFIICGSLMKDIQIIELNENEAEELKIKLENKEIRHVKIRIQCKECNKIVEKRPDVRRFHNWFYCQKCSTKLTHERVWGSLENYKKHNKEKREKTLIEKHGSLKKAHEVRLEHQREHNREQFGCDYYFQTDEFKIKQENTLTNMNNRNKNY